MREKFMEMFINVVQQAKFAWEGLSKGEQEFASIAISSIIIGCSVALLGLIIGGERKQS